MQLGLAAWKVILILAVVLILFGAKKLPELAKGLGTGIKEFKKATREVTDEIQNTPADTKRHAAGQAAAGQYPRSPPHRFPKSSNPPKA